MTFSPHVSVYTWRCPIPAAVHVRGPHGGPIIAAAHIRRLICTIRAVAHIRRSAAHTAFCFSFNN